VPSQTYPYGLEDIQNYALRTREQILEVDANETSRILTRPFAEGSIKLREIQGHTPGSSRGFAKAASSIYAGAPSGLNLADQLGRKFHPPPPPLGRKLGSDLRPFSTEHGIE
jgi:hypothetical protein